MFDRRVNSRYIQVYGQFCLPKISKIGNLQIDMQLDTRISLVGDWATFLADKRKNWQGRQIFVLMDNQSKKHCWPKVKTALGKVPELFVPRCRPLTCVSHTVFSGIGTDAMSRRRKLPRLRAAPPARA